MGNNYLFCVFFVTFCHFLCHFSVIFMSFFSLFVTFYVYFFSFLPFFFISRHFPPILTPNRNELPIGYRSVRLVPSFADPSRPQPITCLCAIDKDSDGAILCSVTVGDRAILAPTLDGAILLAGIWIVY